MEAALFRADAAAAGVLGGAQPGRRRQRGRRRHAARPLHLEVVVGGLVVVGHHGDGGPGRAALLRGVVPRQPRARPRDRRADALRERPHGRRHLHRPQEPGMHYGVGLDWRDYVYYIDLH